MNRQQPYIYNPHWGEKEQADVDSTSNHAAGKKETTVHKAQFSHLVP